MSHAIGKAVLLGYLALAVTLSTSAKVEASTILFDNSGIDVTNPTYNMGAGDGFFVYDDFALTALTTITAFNYDAWYVGPLTYQSTTYQILDGFGGNVLFSGTAVATVTSNGLTNTANPSPGFLHEISGLSFALPAGTYVLGLSANITGGLGIGVASGNGSAQTIGPGLIQNSSLRAGDHMSFQIIGDSGAAATVPEPTSMLLLGTGLIGAGVRRYRQGRSRA